MSRRSEHSSKNAPIRIKVREKVSDGLVKLNWYMPVARKKRPIMPRNTNDQSAFERLEKVTS
jgi:hypothetical protein